MAAPEKSEWQGTPRQRQRPKVDRKSMFFNMVSKIVESNIDKKENPPWEVHKESSLKDNIGESRELEVKSSVERKNEERINTDSKFKCRNTDIQDNVQHHVEENCEKVKTEPNVISKQTHLDFRNNQRHLTNNKNEEVRPELNSKFQYKILDPQDDRTKAKYGAKARTDSNSKINHGSTNFQDHRKNQKIERKHENRVRGESNFSDLHDNGRCSSNRDYNKDRKFDRGDNLRLSMERKYAHVEKGTNSRSSTCHSSESHGRHSYSLRYSDHEVNKSSFRLKNQNYGAKKDEEIKSTSMHESSGIFSLEDQELEEEDIMEFESVKHCREILNPDVKNFKITFKNDEAKSTHLSNTSTESTSLNIVSDSQALNSDLNIDEENFKIPLKIKDARSVQLSSLIDTTLSMDVSDSPASKSDETESICLFSSSIETPSSNAVSDSQTSKNESISVCLYSTLTETSSNDVFDSPTDPVSSSTLTFIASEEENYIPPPVQCKAIREDSGFLEDSSNLAAGRKDELIPQNGSSEALPEFSYLDEDESYYSLPDTGQIEAISNFILRKVKEKSVHNAAANKIERDLNAVFKDQLDGYSVHLYGSYSSDLAISTSDINLAMVSDCSVKKSFMFEVYKVILEEFKNFHVYPYEEGSTTYETKINFSHPESGVKCQLAYLGKYRENICKMGHFLRKISSKDERVKRLILAVKIWSESLCINEVEDGKLHTIGYALMVVYFLQHCENPILPEFPCDLGEKEMLNSKYPNNLSIGELWLSFLKYYASTFDWKQNVISVKSKKCVPKQSKCWESYWLAIEDPFTEKNIAKSVINSDIADYIKACFKSSYDYFYNPPECDEDESSGGLSDTKWEFSFDQCNAEQGDTFCEDCDELMDTCDNCLKKMCVEPIFTAPKMTDGFLEIVKDSLMTVYKNYILTDQEVNDRREFVNKLETKMSRFYPGVFSEAEFSLFGSSANGFGFKNSDVDICITFKPNKVVNSISVLKDVRFLLRKDKDFDQVIAIFSATIPIVKFYYKPKGWRGDISLHNSLAIHNSNLLYTYSLLDERCKILGCALKLLAKKALISEVTDKALSSYSYLNMVIYFLQQTDPPVLPVLQDNKFRNNNYEINHIVENCNVWFCKDLDYIKTVFQTENKTPVEQLWLELLDYYCDFDSDKFISIRQKEPVIVGGKKRTARLFNIQDPFIETKNLGCVVSAQKAQETINVLRRARRMFRTPLKELPSCVKDNEDFFFSTQSLTGRIHKEALCELCGKYGHEKKECSHSNFPFPRFRFKHNPNNRFLNQRRHHNISPCKNYARKPKTFCSKPVYQRV